MSVLNKLVIVAGVVLCGWSVTAGETPLQKLDFTKGDKPGRFAKSYSLHLGQIAGIPNGVQKMGRDASQIYVSSITKGTEGTSLLQVGDVILGVNDKLFEGDVIETWRAAVRSAPERSEDGNLRVIRWRNGTRTTLDYVTVVPPPDLLKGETNNVDRSGTYNLGSTGLRGWIYTKPASDLDRIQGRTTASSRQILVTHVGVNSPASGVMEVNDVILGVGGKLFSSDARKGFGKAITEAEKAENKGILTVTRSRNGKMAEVQLKLRVMGSYSATAPYDCPKSKLILADACKALEKEPLNNDLWGAVNGLALMATGNPNYLPKVQGFARSMAASELNMKGGGSWDCGYKTVFLSEYYLLTGDKDVLPGITALTLKLARGQGMYGTFGHGFSEKTADGKLHGPIPAYGPVNQAGLIANLGIVMGKKCGVKDPEIDPAIERASKFFSYFVDKGGIPYGEHEPVPMHDNNGKNALAALLFGVQGNKTEAARYFSKMATTAYANREYGHTGQGFSYLWSALGANVGGPAAEAAFMKEAAWHLDLVRRSDGSFTYDGGEQYGPGRTDDNTYYGRSSYCGLSPVATYVLTYSVPLKKLFITGRDENKANWLSEKQVAEAISSGRFDVECRKKSPEELVAAFSDWSPVVRSWAAAELAKRPEAPAMVPALIAMTEGRNAHVRQGACETLGYLKCTNALPVLVRLLKHDDRFLRVKAAKAIRNMGDGAMPVLTDLLQVVVDTVEPIQPIVWADPIQLTHGELAGTIFDGLLRSSINGVDRKLLYPAIRAVAGNADAGARCNLVDTIANNLSTDDVQALAPVILAAIRNQAPANTMAVNEIRMACAKVLTRYHYKEGVRALMDLANTIGGHGSEERIPMLMSYLKTYGSAGRVVIPELRVLLENCRNASFPADLNKKRTDAIEDTIASIEAAKDHPELKSFGNN